jgi:multidrug efflux system outer membrane protein
VLIWPVVLALLLGACTLCPDYRRPAVPTPASFRGQGPSESPLSVGDLAWWWLFEDEVLQQVIQEAIRENYDLRVAAARILEARAQVTLTRSFQFP